MRRGRRRSACPLLCTSEWDKDERIENMAMIFTNSASAWKCSLFALCPARKNAHDPTYNGCHDRPRQKVARNRDSERLAANYDNPWQTTRLALDNRQYTLAGMSFSKNARFVDLKVCLHKPQDAIGERGRGMKCYLRIRWTPSIVQSMPRASIYVCVDFITKDIKVRILSPRNRSWCSTIIRYHFISYVLFIGILSKHLQGLLLLLVRQILLTVHPWATENIKIEQNWYEKERSYIITSPCRRVFASTRPPILTVDFYAIRDSLRAINALDSFCGITFVPANFLFNRHRGNSSLRNVDIRRV